MCELEFHASTWMVLKNKLLKNPYLVGKTTKNRNNSHKARTVHSSMGSGGGYVGASKKLEFISLDLCGGYLGRCMITI